MNKYYVVRKGDNLWNISKSQMGSEWEWPKLWVYNNLIAITNLCVKPIGNPDLIFPGQIICMPVNTSSGSVMTKSQKLASKDKPILDVLRNIKLPLSIKVDLNDLRQLPPIKQPGFDLSLELSGSVTVTTKAPVPIIVVRDGQIIASHRTKAVELVKGMFANASIDLSKNSATLKSSFTAPSGKSSKLEVVGINFRAVFDLGEVSGSTDEYVYTAKLQLIAKISPNNDIAPGGQKINYPKIEDPSWFLDVIRTGVGFYLVGSAIVASFTASAVGSVAVMVAGCSVLLPYQAHGYQPMTPESI